MSDNFEGGRCLSHSVKTVALFGSGRTAIGRAAGGLYSGCVFVYDRGTLTFLWLLQRQQKPFDCRESCSSSGGRSKWQRRKSQKRLCWLCFARRRCPFPVEERDDLALYMNPLSKADASVIVLAKEQQALVILTRDRNLRRRARREGIRFATLFDVLLSAKERGVVQAIKPLLDAMGDKGWRLQGKSAASLQVKVHHPNRCDGRRGTSVEENYLR